MGADSCGAWVEDGSYQLVVNPKTFIVDNRFLIGCTTSFRMIDLLRFSLTVPKRTPTTSDDDKYIRTSFVNAVRKLFSTSGFMTRDREDGVENGGNFLVGYNSRLYEVQDDFSVLNLADWGHAIGCGGEPARGSLHTTRDSGLDPEQRILAALRAAEATTMGVRGPFINLALPA
jgi:hypothetical protein